MIKFGRYKTFVNMLTTQSVRVVDATKSDIVSWTQMELTHPTYGKYTARRTGYKTEEQLFKDASRKFYRELKRRGVWR